MHQIKSSMTIAKESHFFNSIFMGLLTITLAITCDSNRVEKSTARENILLGGSYGELNDQGKLRTYYIYTPKSYRSDQPMPLVLVFHGDGGSGYSISHVTRFNNLAERQRFIVVYPDGIHHRWNFQGKVDDVPFVRALIDDIKQQRNIDSHKIYATGFSKGAILTQALACRLSDEIAAFASVAGSLPVRLKPHCTPQTPVSMLMINGTNDLEVHYKGDYHSRRDALLSIPDTVKFWQSHDHCTAFTTRNHHRLKTTHYLNCKDNSEVTQLIIIGGGHFWPGGASTDSDLNRFNRNLGLNASKTIWRFCQRHSRV